MTVEWSRVVDFNAHIVLKVDMIQVVASKERWPGDLLPETLWEFRLWFFHICQIYKNFMWTDEWVSEWVRQLVSE